MLISAICFINLNLYGNAGCTRPAEVVATKGSCFIKIDWTPVEGATLYAIYAGTIRIGFSVLPSFIYETGCTYCFECPPSSYSVSAICDNVESEQTSSNPVATPCRPSLEMTTSNTNCDFVLLSWVVLGDLESPNYEIWRNVINEPSGATFLASTTDVEFYDTAVIPGGLYYYWIVGQSIGGCIVQDEDWGYTPICNICDSDINNDGTVNTTDLLRVIAQWDTSGTADVNDDGIVDVTDVLIVIDDWGPCG